MTGIRESRRRLWARDDVDMKPFAIAGLSRKSRFHSRRGGAAIELAVICPLLILLIIGVVDYGRIFYLSVTIANAARAGAEFGAREPATVVDTAAMTAFAKADGQEAAPMRVDSRFYCECGEGVPNNACTLCPGGAAPDVFVEVTASKSVSTFFRYPGLRSSIPIVRTATFRSQ